LKNKKRMMRIMIEETMYMLSIGLILIISEIKKLKTVVYAVGADGYKNSAVLFGLKNNPVPHVDAHGPQPS
jgi:hypothetical protein